MVKKAISVVVLTLAGCGSGTPAQDRTAAAPTTIRNEYHERMSVLDDLRRNAALRGAIRSSNESCDRVEASAFQRDYENLKMWTVRCKSNAYAVFLAANGDVQVRDCAQAAELKLPVCVVPQAASEPQS